MIRHIQLKALLVTSLLLMFFACREQNEDYDLIKKIHNNNNKNYELSKSNTNIEVIDFLKKLKFDRLNDSIIGLVDENYFLKKKIILEGILNTEEIDNILLQKTKLNSQWNKFILNKFKNNRSKSIHISKPVYDIKRKKAFIYIEKPTTSYIAIYEFEKDQWNEVGLLNPKMKQNKATIFNY